MGMEGVGRAGSVVPIFVPFRDRGRVVGYSTPSRRVSGRNCVRGCSSQGFSGIVGGRNATFAPVEDTYIQRGEGTAFGRKAQLKVDGSPKSVELMKLDVSVLNSDSYNNPEQILTAVLRLYSMIGSDLGGVVSITQEPIERMQVYQGSAGASLHQRTAH